MSVIFVQDCRVIAYSTRKYTCLNKSEPHGILSKESPQNTVSLNCKVGGRNSQISYKQSPIEAKLENRYHQTEGALKLEYVFCHA
jgi:hypothetical protein